jgi:hypothetical protein
MPVGGRHPGGGGKFFPLPIGSPQPIGISAFFPMLLKHRNSM